MSTGTSKRIKRPMSVMISSNRTASGTPTITFKNDSFNNTQRFTDHKLTVQQYEKSLELQKQDLVKARDNASFIAPVIEEFNHMVDEWLEQIDNASNDEEAKTIFEDVVSSWVTTHNLSENEFLSLVYLFQATYIVGNSQSVKKSNTSSKLEAWWNAYGIVHKDNSIKQLVFKNAEPNDTHTLYWAAAMQNQLATKIQANACRVILRDKNSSPWNVDLTPILATDILPTYGVAPVCPAPCPVTIVRRTPRAFLVGLKYLLLFWRKCLTDLGARGIEGKTIHYIDLPVTEGIIKTDTFYIGLDCEYVSRELPSTVKKDKKITKVRNLDDVLSFQLYAINKDGTKFNGLIIHNVSQQHFVQSELISAIQRVIEPLRFANVEPSKRRAIVHLYTYYGGVDISCFAGWERFWNATNVIVLKKNAPFSLGSVKKKLNDGSTITIDITDLMNDAPVGGLSTVGAMVGIPKINTEVFDVADGLPKGYYKEHMNIFRQKRPRDFDAYAMNDAVITLKYALFLKDHLGKVPRTIGSYASSEVSKQRKDYPDQFLADPDRPLRDYVQSKGAECVRPGQADLYEESRKALYGGHNCSYVSGYGYGRVLDFDLASAYNVAGHLLPIVDYSDDSYPLVKPIDIAKYMHRTSFNSEVSSSFRLKDCDFSLIGQQMDKSSVFLIGIGKFKIDYPDDSKFIVTPSHSETGAPVYVKHYIDWCPLLDAFNAWKHGARVHVIRLRIPKQNQDGLNVFGDFQNKEIKLRNAAKAKMKHSKKDSPQYAQANGEQLLHKLTANSTYGKTLQGASGHKSRDFDTYLMAETPKSTVTDPLIGDNYTAFTRYLVSILYDASNHCSTKALQLNITTDGLSLVISPEADADKFIQEMTDYYNSEMEQFYFDRLHLAGKNRGFELKANVVDFWFNLRTRVNGVAGYSKRSKDKTLPDIDKGIFATASMQGQDSNDLFNYVRNNIVSIKNPNVRLSNLTEMKFRIQNHYGSQEMVEQVSNVTLGYDFAYKPFELKKGPNYCYITTIPFHSIQEHDKAKELGGKLTKMVPMRLNNTNFDLFLQTMTEAPVIKHNLTTLKDRSKYINDYLQYCNRHYLYDISLGVLDGDLNSEISDYCDRWGSSPSSIKKAIRRVKAGTSKVNYVCGWYYKEVLKNE